MLTDYDSDHLYLNNLLKTSLDATSKSIHSQRQSMTRIYSTTKNPGIKSNWPTTNLTLTRFIANLMNKQCTSSTTMSQSCNLLQSKSIKKTNSQPKKQNHMKKNKAPDTKIYPFSNTTTNNNPISHIQHLIPPMIYCGPTSQEILTPLTTGPSIPNATNIETNYQTKLGKNLITPKRVKDSYE